MTGLFPALFATNCATLKSCYGNTCASTIQTNPLPVLVAGNSLKCRLVSSTMRQFADSSGKKSTGKSQNLKLLIPINGHMNSTNTDECRIIY